MIDLTSKKIIIFDLDGTLFDTLPDLHPAINAMLLNYGLSTLNAEQVRAFIGNGSRNLVRRCLGDSSVSLDEAHKVFLSYYRKHCVEKTKPYPGVIEFLKKDFKAAVLTNKPIEPTRLILSHFGLLGRFEVVLGGDTTPERKPSPLGIDFILSQTGFKKEEALMVGDDTPDLLAARAAEIDSILILEGFGGKENILPNFPENTIGHFSELLNFHL